MSPQVPPFWKQFSKTEEEEKAELEKEKKLMQNTYAKYLASTYSLRYR
jgi:hypothetical protein